MKNLNLFFFVLLAISGINCKENIKSKAPVAMEKTSGKFDLSEIDFNDDLESMLGIAEYKNKRSDITEYITDRRTVQVDTFKLGNVEFELEFRINDINIPNESFLSLNTQNEATDTIMAIHIQYNFIGSENYLVDKLKKQFKEPELLSKEGSTNEFIGLKNYHWPEISKNTGLIFSQSSYGSAVGLDNDTSEKIYSAEIYVINNEAIIRYPNGQREAILEKLMRNYTY